MIYPVAAVFAQLMSSLPGVAVFTAARPERRRRAHVDASRDGSSLCMLLTASLLIGGCGGGGGSGDSSGGQNLPLSVGLSPSSWAATSYPGHPVSLMVTASITGTYSGNVAVIIRDDSGVISPNVSIVPWGKDYWVTLHSVSDLEAGEYSGDLRVDLCSDLSCSRRLGQATLPYQWTIAPESAIASLSPSSVEAGAEELMITLTGQGFLPQSVVRWNGSVRTTTYVSSTELIAQIPGRDLRSAKLADIDVRTQLGGIGLFTTAPAQFAVANRLPVVTSLSPSSVPAGSDTFDLPIAGQDFVLDSVVLVNGVARNTRYVSGTGLTARLFASEMAEGRILEIAVANPEPGGGTSEPVPFTILNAEPQAATTDPGHLEAGCATTLVAINGSGFVPGTVLLWDGEERPTEVLSADRLQAVIPAADLVLGREVELSVRSPEPGGGLSPPLAITIRPDRSPTTPSTSFRINPAHSGIASVGCPRALSMAPDWSFDFSGDVVTPLVADGKVFVVEHSLVGPGLEESRLRALDAITGTPIWGPVAFQGSAYAAYDAGKLFVAAMGGESSFLLALDAQNGEPAWEHEFVTRASYRLAPVAHEGIVIVTFGRAENNNPADSGTLAFDQESGAVVWQDRNLLSLSNTLPAIHSGRAYFRMRTGASAYDLHTGERLWSASITSATTSMPIIAGLYLYTRSGSAGSTTYWQRRDSGSGEVLDTFEVVQQSLPAVQEDVRYQNTWSGLTAVGIADGTERWRVTAGEPQVVVNDTVLAGSNTLYAVDAQSGEVRARVPDLGMLVTSAGDSSQPVVMAVGEGVLVVPRYRRIIVFRIGEPSP